MTPDPALLQRIGDSLRSDLRPVHPLPSTKAIAATLSLVFASAALIGATALGWFGFQRLTAIAIAVIFPVLAALAVMAANASATAMIPGSPRPFHPAVLLLIAWLGIEIVFSLVFHDYSTGQFVHQGMVCLRAGLLWAAPTGIVVWLVIRRGFAVDRGAAGIAVGTLAGLAGLTVLELHCPNLRLPHIAVWHLAVLPIAALVGQMTLSSVRRK